MARQDTERLQREIDNLLRDLKRSGEDLAATGCKLQKLFELSAPQRGVKSREPSTREAHDMWNHSGEAPPADHSPKKQDVS